MARIAPAGKRFFPAYYSNTPLPSDVYLQQCSEAAPFEDTRIRAVVTFPQKVFRVDSQNPDKYFSFTGFMKRPEDCSLFEEPYYSPSYMPVPVNYSTRLPHWTDSRKKKDWLANWGNADIYNDRAFGGWHKNFGHRYFYGDTRRL